MTNDRQRTLSRLRMACRALVAVAALGAATATATPPVPAQDGAATDLLLVGPTGSRAGVPVADASAPPAPEGLVPLDTYGRDPSLRITARDPDAAWSAWVVRATRLADPSGRPVGAGEGPRDLAAGVADEPVEIVALRPPPPGEWLVVASLRPGDSPAAATWAWRIVIPDRSLPEALPAPDIVLFASGGTVVTERGSGCFLGDCGDIGMRPPDADLPRLRLGLPDEPIIVILSDGGAMVSLRVAATPIDAGGGPPAVLREGSVEPPSHRVLLPPPPAPGAWRLELSARFADDRGRGEGFAVVDVP